MSFGLPLGRFWPVLFGVLFLAFDANAVTIFGPQTQRTCRTPAEQRQARDLWLAACLANCDEQFANTNPQVTKEVFAKNCEHEYDKFSSPGHVAKTMGEILVDSMKCDVKAAGKAVGSFLSLLDMALGSGRRLPKGYTGTYEDCQVDDQCKLAFARNLDAFDKMKPVAKPAKDSDRREAPSEWVVSDRQVIEQIHRQNLSLNELIVQGDHQRDMARNDCSRELASIRQPYLSSGEDYDERKQREVYDKLAMTHPRCVALLPLYPPGFEEKVKEFGPKLLQESGVKPSTPKPPFLSRSWLDQLALGRTCIGRDVAVEFCADVVQVLVPIPLIGPQSKFLALPGKFTAKVSAAEIATAAKEFSHAQKEDSPETAAKVAADGSGGATGDFAAKGKTAVSDAPAPVKATLAPEKAASRTAFAQEFKDKVYATEKQNMDYIDQLANAEKNPNSVQTVSFENSAMKALNDGTGDKNLVTALTNYHKELLIPEIEKLRAKYPGLKFDIYSDFKSVQVAASGLDKAAAGTGEALVKDLKAALEKTNSQFAKKVEELGLKDVPKAGKPETWFKAGSAPDFEEMNLLARYARKTGKPFEESSEAFRQEMTGRLADVEQKRSALASSSNFKELMDTSSGAAVPKTDVFDLTRKYSNANDLASAVRKRYGLTSFGTGDAQQLLDYAKGVDEFSPSILIPKREVLTLDSARKGGVSADFLGLGSENLQSTAKGLAKQKDLKAALRSVRAQERQVTQNFRTRMQAFKNTTGKNFVCSGDDCVYAAKLSFDDKVKMLNSVANDAKARQVRISFVAENVPQVERMKLAAHGEGIEKTLRKELEGKIPFDKLDKGLVFGVDMRGIAEGQGAVNLIVGRSGGVTLSAAEKAKIYEAFQTAVKKYNGGTLNYRAAGVGTQDVGLKLQPGAGVFGYSGRNGDE